MVAQIPSSDNPEERKAKEVVQKVFGMIMKLGPVLGKMDFYSSAATQSTQEGPVVRSEHVVTYKSNSDGKTASGHRPNP